MPALPAEVGLEQAAAFCDLAPALMAELFQTTPQNVTQHLKALYQEGEIDETATCKNYLQVRTEGRPQ